MSTSPQQDSVTTDKAPRRRSATQAAVAWRRFKRNKSALLGLVIVGAYIVLAFFGPYFAAYPPRSTEALFQGQAHLPPSWAHPFGTEPTGVDVFSDSIWSTRNDLYVGLVATLIATALGIAIGAVAGYSRGAISSIVLAIIQVFFVVPVLLLILLFARIFELYVVAGWGLTLIVVILGFFGWSGIAFVVRGEILRVKELEFVQAEKALGANNFRILFRHIVPNILTPVIVLASLGVAGNIITEVVISFLGFGDPNTATWGLLIQEGFRYVSTYWWVSLFPGLLVVFLVLGFNLLGDGLSDALNPRLRE
ncbi:MAG TPA: ABC transporter permease [Conexivisphaerales archaeon]|nr:ABC transporter permease [Conexivisphaerales archaeon]